MSDRYRELRDCAGSVSRETFEAILTFEREFRRWSGRINLASATTLDAIWSRHILDSAQLMRLAPEALCWLDLGSGGGFPGAVIAILARDRPGSRVDLVESNRKKAAFLQTTLGMLGAPARVHAMRIEQAASRVSGPEIVTARALAPLPALIELACPWLAAGATALFHKGRDYRREIVESRYHWNFDLVDHVSRVDPESRILEISNVHPTGGSRPDVQAA